MKRELIGLAIIGTLALNVAGAIAFFSVAIMLTHRSAAGGPVRGHHDGFVLEQLPKALNMTSDQQTRVQPIIDQVQPQIIAIHRQEKERIHRAIDSTVSQIRPLLTPDQQARLDDVEKARQDLFTAQEKLRIALNE
jgi:hypothetical protein